MKSSLRTLLTILAVVVTSVGHTAILAKSGAFPDCLPEAPKPAAQPGIWVPFHLLPGNYPVLAVRADTKHIDRGVVASDAEALCRQPSGSRKLATVDEQYAGTLNRWLEGNPPVILQGVGGLLVGAVDPLAGALLGALSTALDQARRDPGFRVRTGDEIWRVDLAGREQGRSVYIVYTVLLDPFRKTQWLMNEKRMPIQGKADDTNAEIDAEDSEGE